MRDVFASLTGEPWLMIFVAKKTDAERLAEQLLAGATPEEGRALLDSLLSGRVSSIFEKVQSAELTLRAAPAEVCGFRVRLDLHAAMPPVWRRRGPAAPDRRLTRECDRVDR